MYCLPLPGSWLSSEVGLCFCPSLIRAGCSPVRLSSLIWPGNAIALRSHAEELHFSCPETTLSLSLQVPDTNQCHNCLPFNEMFSLWEGIQASRPVRFNFWLSYWLRDLGQVTCPQSLSSFTCKTRLVLTSTCLMACCKDRRCCVACPAHCRSSINGDQGDDGGDNDDGDDGGGDYLK